MNAHEGSMPFLLNTRLVPAQTFPWGELRWLCNEHLSAGAAQTLGHCLIFPGKLNALHYHPNCEELLYLVKGEGEHRYNDDWVKMQAGSLIRIPAGVRHALRNTGTDVLECIISFSSGDRQTVFLE